MKNQFESHIAPQYVARRDALAPSFVEGQRFLLALETLCQPGDGFHLNAAKNLHLYFEDRFLAYITIEGLTKSQPFLRFSPAPNAQQEGTSNGSEVLVPRPLDHLIMNNGGYRAKWGAYDRKKVVIDLKTGAPDTFFSKLLELVRSAKTEEEE